MASESAFRGFDRTFWTRAIGAVMLVCIAVGSTAAMAATPDAALVEGSQRLLIASVLVFAAIGFVGYRMAGGYIESLKHDVEIAQPANDDATTAKAAAPVEVTTVTSRVTPVAARPTPVRGRVTAESLPQPIKVAPKMPEPQPIQPVRGLFMRSETPSRARLEPRNSVVSRVEPRSAAPAPVTSPVVSRVEARSAALVAPVVSPVASPVVARSGRTAPVTPVTSSVQPRQVERVVARSTPSRSEPVRETARETVREPVRAETARREAPREVARETIRTAVAPTVVTSRVQGVRGRESGVRARA